jgi:adenylate cyclase
MAAELTKTTLLRLAEARRNEDQVLAESAILGERRVTWARLAMIAVFALSQEVLARALHRAFKFDWPRMTVIALYIVFAIVSVFALRRVRPAPRRAMFMPLLPTFVDAAYMTFMGWRGYDVDGVVYPEMGAIVFAVILCFSVARFSWLHVVLSTVLSCVGFVISGWHGHALSPTATPFVLCGYVALGVLVALTNRSVRRMFPGLRSRDNLSKFLPRAIVERVLSGGEDALRPVQVEVTVLFSDIRDFTALSESMPPRAVLEFLDEYFGHMAQVVKGHDGVVNKFLGDGMLAFWGVPDRNPRHAELALKAALDMRRKLAELNDTRAKAGAAAIRFGVGVHTGTVAAGMLGGADQHEYTVIGDAVNVASRIEGLTKQLGADILVSERTWSLAGGRFAGRRLAEERVKGRSDPVVVYALDDDGARPAADV